MSWKDSNGIWREDGFRLHWEYSDEIEMCPNCGDFLELDLDPLDCEFDFELEKDWELDKLAWDDPQRANFLDQLLSFHWQTARCYECWLEFEYGKCIYYNPDKNCYDLQRPLKRAEAEKQEVIWQHQQQVAAGQLPLFQ